MANLPPERAALLVAVGLALGVFPIFGFPTLLCLGAALTFRLNIAALQLLNNVFTPAQIALLLPLERAGARLCGSSAAPASVAGKVGLAGVHAVAGWAVICLPICALVYFALIRGLRMSHRT